MRSGRSLIGRLVDVMTLQLSDDELRTVEAPPGLLFLSLSLFSFSSRDYYRSSISFAFLGLFQKRTFAELEDLP